jgi:hypothetical protein
VDVVYVADDAAGTGFQKYSLVGGNWTANGNIAVTGNALRGITGVVSGSNVTLYGSSPTGLFSVTDNSGYNATITGSVTTLATTAANTAFRGLAFTPEATILPVRFTTLKATQKSNGIQVDWSNLTETDVDNYSVERSTNGRNFTSVATKTATKNNGGKADYQYLDLSANGDYFYRIKATETSGKIVYSNIVRINTGKSTTELVVYPNPVRGNEFTIQISSLPEGKYSVRLLNAQGQEMSSRALNHGGGAVSETISLNNLKSGVYFIQINGTVQLQKQFIVQ